MKLGNATYLQLSTLSYTRNSLLSKPSKDTANIALQDSKKSHNYPQSMTHMGLRLDAQFAS